MRRLLLACASTFAVLAIVGCEDVIGPIGDPVDLSYAPCVGATDYPTWFAVQDGDGDWKQVSPSGSGSFDFSFSSGKGGIAMMTPDDGLFVTYATTEEFQSELPACNGSVRFVSGSATGYATQDNVQLAMGTSAYVVFGTEAPPATFVLSDVDATATDLVAVRYRTSSGTGSLYQADPNSVFIRRNITGSSTPLVDFSSATEAGAPVPQTLNVTNLSTGEALSVFSYVGLTSTLANIAEFDRSAVFVTGSVTAPFWAVPATRLNANESQMVIASATKSVGSGQESRVAAFAFTNPADQAITLGPSLGAVTVSGGSRPSASYNVQAAYDRLFDVVFSQGNDASFRQAEVLATSAYLDGATSVTLQVPNLSGASGFQSSWLLSPGVSSTWSFLATDATLAVLNNRATTYQAADRLGIFTP